MERPISASMRQDDLYNTRQHALNIGLSYFSICLALVLFYTVAFGLKIAWVGRGLIGAAAIGIVAFAKSLIDFTNESRDIQWRANVRESAREQTDYNSTTEQKEYKPVISRGAFPSPTNGSGLLFTTVPLDRDQREQIAKAASQHGKLTVNYLIGLGLKREEAERLREELVGHGLLAYNERNEAVVTSHGKLSFGKVLK